MVDHLRRAHEELETAERNADRQVREQLQSIDQGVFEEQDGVRTQDDPGPKPDRIAELREKLERLEERADEPTGSHIDRAVAYLGEAMKEGEVE